MFLYIFSACLIAANVYCFIKKKYLYLFVPCMLFLPKYYGLEINILLPVISVTRIMYIVFYIYSYINRKRNITFSFSKIKTIPREYYLLIGYFVLRIISNLFYLTSFVNPIKTIYSLIFEQLLLFVSFYMLAPSKDEINTLLKTIVWSAAFLFALGIFESITLIRPFDELYTISRSFLNDHYIRLGLLRATTTMGLANFYGNMCMLLLPCIFYLYKLTMHKRYLIVLFLDFYAIIHSGCRSNLIFSAIVIFLYFFIALHSAKERIHFVKNLSLVLVSMVAVIVVLSLCNQNLNYYYTGTAKSLLNEVGYDYDLDSDAPSNVPDGYGDNSSSGKTARVIQFSGIYYTLTHNPLFGFGSGSQTRGVKYYDKDIWATYYTYDTGIVEIILDEGILGLLGYISLFLFFFRLLCKSKTSMRTYSRQVCVVWLLTYLLSTLSSTNMISFLIVSLCIIFCFNSFDHSFNQNRNKETTNN